MDETSNDIERMTDEELIEGVKNSDELSSRFGWKGNVQERRSGLFLIELKKRTKASGVSWVKFVKTNFPTSKSTIERKMLYASRIDAEPEIIFRLTVTHALAIVRENKKKKLEKILIDHGIDFTNYGKEHKDGIRFVADVSKIWKFRKVKAALKASIADDKPQKNSSRSGGNAGDGPSDSESKSSKVNSKSAKKRSASEDKSHDSVERESEPNVPKNKIKRVRYYLVANVNSVINDCEPLIERLLSIKKDAKVLKKKSERSLNLAQPDLERLMEVIIPLQEVIHSLDKWVKKAIDRD